MVVVVSLLTAALFGSGDFCGGLAAKNTTPVRVVAGSHLVGLVGVAAAAVVVAAEFRMVDFVLGALGGGFGGIGVGLLYRRLAIGPMHVVAPLTALTSAVVPAAWGFVIGEQLTMLTLAGVGVGLVAIALISTTSEGESAPVTVQALVESLVAGCGFGGFFILLDATAASSAPWPVVGARTQPAGASSPSWRCSRRSIPW